MYCFRKLKFLWQIRYKGPHLHRNAHAKNQDILSIFGPIKWKLITVTLLSEIERNTQVLHTMYLFVESIQLL